MQDQTATTTSSPPSSSDRSSSSKEGMDSDDDIGRVPEFRLGQGGPSTSGREATAAGTSSGLAQSAAAAQASSHRRGRSPADKEHRRLKRLLRNRCQEQARERKKAYMGELEVKVKDLETRNSELEERLSTLQNENQMLRQILKTPPVTREDRVAAPTGTARAYSTTV
ncbi:hypothetical protein ZWY2020_002746 [Hordeum vulgare]|nr:hypothetical protein ZWY2020_002746 [Hordeum vulgare]